MSDKRSKSLEVNADRFMLHIRSALTGLADGGSRVDHLCRELEEERAKAKTLVEALKWVALNADVYPDETTVEKAKAALERVGEKI